MSWPPSGPPAAPRRAGPVRPRRAPPSRGALDLLAPCGRPRPAGATPSGAPPRIRGRCRARCRAWPDAPRASHGGGPPVALAGGGVFADRQVGAFHALGQLLLDLFQVPDLGALVLQPLVVADADAARVGEDVGDHRDAPSPPGSARPGDRWGRWRPRRRPCSAGRAPRPRRSPARGRRGRRCRPRPRRTRLARDRLGAGVPGHAAGAAHVFGQLEGVDAVGVGDVALPVADRDQGGAGAGEDPGGVRADVAEALHGVGRAVEVEAAVAGPLGDAVDDALAGGLLAPVRAAGGDGLAGDDPAGLAPVGGVGEGEVRVHHPDHGLGVGAHVGRGDVVVGADVVAEGVGEAAGDALELAGRVLAGLELDAALGAAEGDVVQGALEGHPGGQRLDLVERHLLVVAHAALVGTEHVVVLDPVALEQTVARRCPGAPGSSRSARSSAARGSRGSRGRARKNRPLFRTGAARPGMDWVYLGCWAADLLAWSTFRRRRGGAGSVCGAGQGTRKKVSMSPP